MVSIQNQPPVVYIFAKPTRNEQNGESDIHSPARFLKDVSAARHCASFLVFPTPSPTFSPKIKT